MKSVDSKTVNCKINGENYSFQIGDGKGDILPSKTLAEVLRGMLLLTGTKTPCNKGACGGCTVLKNGKPILACSNLIVECDGAEILTIEGLKDPAGIYRSGRYPVWYVYAGNDTYGKGIIR